MSYEGYDVDIVAKYRFQIVGWPEDIPFRACAFMSPEELRRLVDLWRAGACWWVAMTKLQVDAHIADVAKRVKDGELKKGRAVRSDKGKKRIRSDAGKENDSDADKSDKSDDDDDDATRTRPTKRAKVAAKAPTTVAAKAPAIVASKAPTRKRRTSEEVAAQKQEKEAAATKRKAEKEQAKKDKAAAKEAKKDNAAAKGAKKTGRKSAPSVKRTEKVAAMMRTLPPKSKRLIVDSNDEGSAPGGSDDAVEEDTDDAELDELADDF